MKITERHTIQGGLLLGLCTIGLWFAGCSTTRRLAADDILYTGVKKITINTDTSGTLSSTVESAVKDPLSVKPNNPLYSPYVRTPSQSGYGLTITFIPKKRKALNIGYITDYQKNRS